ncbi:MAG: hypothetical protein N2449_08470 [Bacteroidales bacterium]|nr:hypothetical protein [Bacteroidales bacterium]
MTDKLEFTPEELEEMRQFYRDELRMLIKKIEKVSAMLEKLGAPSNIDVSVYKKTLVPNEIYAKQIIIKPEEKEPEKAETKEFKKQKKSELKMLTKWEDIMKRAEIDPLVKEFMDLMNDESIPVIEFGYKKREKKTKEQQVVDKIIASNYKRSKNILWSDYVYDKLRLTGYPLTVEELKNYAIQELELNDEDKDAAFSAIHSALFRLKKNQKSINNYALKGSRTSYYGLAEWFTKEGKLLKKHSRPF